MAWTDTTRAQYGRKTDRYASDCSDEEWVLIEPFLPGRKNTGRPRKTDLREVWNAIQYMAATGCQWLMIPKDFPPPSTVQRYFYDWRDNGILHQINHALVMIAREAQGREASPSAGIIDSQTVKTTESGGVSGYDATSRHLLCKCLPGNGKENKGPQAAHRHRYNWLRNWLYYSLCCYSGS